MWVIAVRHAESLPLEQCAGFLQSLRQDLEELSPLLWQPQSPQDRQCLFDVIEQSRLVLETLDYDVLPRYSPDPEYEDDPPEYSSFVRLPASLLLPVFAAYMLPVGLVTKQPRMMSF